MVNLTVIADAIKQIRSALDAVIEVLTEDSQSPEVAPPPSPPPIPPPEPPIPDAPATVASLLESSHANSSNDSRDASSCWRKAGVTGGIPSRTQIHATLSPQGRGRDDSTQINNAINRCPEGQVVLLGPGTFTLTRGNAIWLTKDNITLRGSGMGVTNVVRDPGAVYGTDRNGGNPMSAVFLSKARWNTGFGNPVNLTEDARSGAVSITVANASSFVVGAPILIDETTGAQWMPSKVWNAKVWAAPDYRVVWRKHDPSFGGDNFGSGVTPADQNTAGSWFNRPDRPTCEVKLVTAIEGNTIRFDTPLTMTYRKSNQAQACIATDWGSGNNLSPNLGTFVSNSGIENLTLSNGDDGTLQMQICNQCWVKDVEILHSLGSSLDMRACFRCEIVGCYFRDAAWPTPGGAGYHISWSWGCSEVLLHDCISVRANKVMVVRACGAGSVVSYNYMDVGFISFHLTWQENGLNASHMVGPHHVLFEGNYSFNLDHDSTHGNSIYLTGFRNRLTGFRSDFEWQGTRVSDRSNPTGGNNYGPLRCAGGANYTYWLSYIGNILGEPGLTTQENGWVVNRQDHPGGWASNSIFSFGTEQMAPNGQDHDVSKFALVNGNYDFLQNKQSWDDNGPKTLPDSFYLDKAPSYFSGLMWPWVDPVTGTTHALPAKARYDAMN